MIEIGMFIDTMIVANPTPLVMIFWYSDCLDKISDTTMIANQRYNNDDKSAIQQRWQISDTTTMEP